MAHQKTLAGLAASKAGKVGGGLPTMVVLLPSKKVVTKLDSATLGSPPRPLHAQRCLVLL